MNRNGTTIQLKNCQNHTSSHKFPRRKWLHSNSEKFLRQQLIKNKLHAIMKLLFFRKNSFHEWMFRFQFFFVFINVSIMRRGKTKIKTKKIIRLRQPLAYDSSHTCTQHVCELSFGNYFHAKSNRPGLLFHFQKFNWIRNIQSTRERYLFIHFRIIYFENLRWKFEIFDFNEISIFNFRSMN